MSWFVDRLSKKQKKKRKQLRNAAQVGIGLMKSWKKKHLYILYIILELYFRVLKTKLIFMFPKGEVYSRRYVRLIVRLSGTLCDK